MIIASFIVWSQAYEISLTEIERIDRDGNRCSDTPSMFHWLFYRDANKGLHVLLSRTHAGPGRTVKQQQEEISRNLGTTL